MTRPNSDRSKGQIKEFSRQSRIAPPSNARSYLTHSEIERLLHSVRSDGRYPLRNSLIILLGFRHGLRVNEICNLQWDDIDFATHLIYIHRSKKGVSTHHRLEKDEIRMLHRMQRKPPYSPFIFTSERGACLTEDAIAKMIAKVGIKAGFTYKIHPHQLRHSCAHHLAAIGVPVLEIKVWLGHVCISSTMKYIDAAAVTNKSYWAN